MRVWIFSAILAVSAAALHWEVIRYLPAVQSPSRVSWWLVALLFYLAEVFVVHIQFQQDAHSFSMSEIPLLVGLFFLPPTALIFARLVGSAAALVIHRRQPPLKLFFNLSHFWLGGCLAAVVFLTVAQLGEPLGPAGWCGALLAALATVAVGDVVIDTAIYLSGGGLPLKKWVQLLTLGVVSTGANTILALATVTILWSTPRATWLVFGLTTVFFFSYRAYTRERRKHESLELLYESTHLLQQGRQIEPAVVALLQHLRKMFKAEMAQLTLFPSDDDERALCTTVGATGAADVMQRIDPPATDWKRAHEAISGGNAVLLSDLNDACSIERCFSARPTKNAMLAPLHGETRVVGVFMVADRLGDIDSFKAEDLRLFGTVANHASVALENGRLEKSLAQVTELEGQLRYQAFHDPLTGLANRALFADRVEHALAHRDSAQLAVLFLDLDDFKNTNDSLGHEAGDQLLVAVARRILNCLRPGDTAARLGGDEFAILLENIPDTSVPVVIADRFNEALNKPFDLNGTEVSVHASLGIAVTQGDESSNELLRNADIAMYKAKVGGKGRFEIFEPHMHAGVLKRLELRRELERALEQGEFTLHYQPLHSLEARRVVGVEALLRWEHPERGLLFPDDFISLCEESRLIIPIGRWVLREACRQTKSWQDMYGGDVPLCISVNLSARQLQHDRLLEDVAGALRESGLSPGSLVLEITESVLMQDTEANMGKLHDLKRLGVELALDDFGTGYSSLSYLRRFPLDILKIPKAFVDDVGRASDHSTLAAAIIKLAGGFGLRTVAEGIETREQLQALMGLDCDLGQGFLLTKPLTSGAMETLLGRLCRADGERHERRAASAHVG